jgi:hypothetical protein
MPAAKLNIAIEQGALFEMVATLVSNSQPMDLTGYTFQGQLRSSVSDSAAVASFSFQLLDQTQTQTKGKVRLYIPSALTQSIPVGTQKAGSKTPAKYLFDVAFGPQGGERYRLFDGVASVSPGVTK